MATLSSALPSNSVPLLLGPLLMNGVEEEESAPARRARGEKVERILAGLRALFPSPDAGEGLLATA